MIVTKTVILIGLGIIFGIVISAGLFAFITLVGVVTRLAIRTSTANRILLYEDIIVVGAAIGNYITIFRPELPIGPWFSLVTGFFFGMHVGCLAMAIEECVQVFPIIIHRMRIVIGVPALILVFAISKAVGVYIQFFL